MRSTLQVEADGLVAAAERLRATAAELTHPVTSTHPTLAADQTSVAAAFRLTAVATALQSMVADQAAALVATADHLGAIATGFAAQETANTAAIRTLTSASDPVGAPGLLAPLPNVAADARPPLPSPTEVDGEVVARQLCAGSASAGSAFAKSWRGRSVAAATTADGIHDVVAALPNVWNGPCGAEAASERLLRHAEAFAQIAERAAALADQADTHARGYSGVVANIPKPAQFDAVRAQLHQALEANATFPGRYTPLVSSLIAQHGALRQQALNAQTEYHGQTDVGTAPEPDPGSPEQAEQLTAQLSGMLPGLLGAVGGMVGGAISAATQLPQALAQTGQQLAQAATGVTSLGMSPAHELNPATTGLEVGQQGTDPPGGPGDGPTTPAGATAVTPVTPSTSSSPPPVTTPAPCARPAALPTAGANGVPMAMPMGMRPPATATQAGTKVGDEKKIVVRVVPHTEPVTGRTTPERLDGRRPIPAEFP